MKNKKVSLILFILLTIIGTPQVSFTEDGKFDLKKVRKAVQDGNIVDKNGERNETSQGNEDINYSLLIIKMIGYVLFLTLMVIAIIYGLRKTGLFGNAPVVTVRSMDILESLPLGPNRSIVLIRMMDQVLVLGQTNQSITTLGTIEGEKAMEIISSGTENVHTVKTFKDAFGKFVDKMKKN